MGELRTQTLIYWGYIHRGGGWMRKFLTELRGKTVMTNDGQIIGMIDNFVVETSNGNIQHVLVTPAEDIEVRLFQTDTSGRLILPFKSMRAVKDVVVMELANR